MQEESLLITPYYSRRGDGLMGSTTVIRNTPKTKKDKEKNRKYTVVKKITASPDQDYDGFCVVTGKGIYELKISREASCCDVIDVRSSHPLDELQHLEVEEWEVKFPPENPPEEIRKKFNLTIGEDYSEDNPLFMVLRTGGYNKLDKDIYLMVNNIHNGYYSRHALFTYIPRDGTGTETLLSVYL